MKLEKSKNDKAFRNLQKSVLLDELNLNQNLTYFKKDLSASFNMYMFDEGANMRSSFGEQFGR